MNAVSFELYQNQAKICLRKSPLRNVKQIVARTNDFNWLQRLFVTSKLDAMTSQERAWIFGMEKKMHNFCGDALML